MFFPDQEGAEQTVREVQEILLKQIEKDSCVCKKTGYLLGIDSKERLFQCNYPEHDYSQKGYPIIHRLAANLRKYGMLSSKGLAIRKR